MFHFSILFSNTKKLANSMKYLDEYHYTKNIKDLTLIALNLMDLNHLSR